jgi:hypothetical protein
VLTRQTGGFSGPRSSDYVGKVSLFVNVAQF